MSSGSVMARKAKRKRLRVSEVAYDDHGWWGFAEHDRELMSSMASNLRETGSKSSMELAAQVSYSGSEAAFEDKVVLLMRRLCISSIIQNLNNSLLNERLKGSSLVKLQHGLPYDLRIRSYSTLNKREKVKALIQHFRTMSLYDQYRSLAFLQAKSVFYSTFISCSPNREPDTSVYSTSFCCNIANCKRPRVLGADVSRCVLCKELSHVRCNWANDSMCMFKANNYKCAKCCIPETSVSFVHKEVIAFIGGELNIDIYPHFSRERGIYAWFEASNISLSKTLNQNERIFVSWLSPDGWASFPYPIFDFSLIVNGVSVKQGSDVSFDITDAVGSIEQGSRFKIMLKFAKHAVQSKLDFDLITLFHRCLVVHRVEIPTVGSAVPQENTLIAKEEAMLRVKNLLKDNGGISMPSIEVSLRCPISFQIMKSPVLCSKNAKHVQCVDRSVILNMFARETKKRVLCPLCRLEIRQLSDIRICGLTKVFLQEYSKGNKPCSDKVRIDEKCVWNFVNTSVKVRAEQQEIVCIVSDSEDESEASVGANKPALKPSVEMPHESVQADDFYPPDSEHFEPLDIFPPNADMVLANLVEGSSSQAPIILE